MKIDDLPPVSIMMRSAGLEPKKSLGQNFLFDLNLTKKIAGYIPDLENMTVLEVGPGPGGLTRALLAMGAKKVIAIEKDKNTMPILKKIQNAADGKLEVIYGDALKFESSKLKIENEKFAICANLPYNVGTELLIKWIHSFRPKSMTLMFQKEVADRIIAKPNSKQYGRLSVLVAAEWNAKILFNVPNTAFCPPPKVQSAVVQMMPRPGGNVRIDKLEKLTAALFGQRRKMIRSIMPDVDWTQFGLKGTERAENLSPEKFIEIASSESE